MKINSYRIKRFFSISTPSLSLPYQMALSVTSDRERFHLIMSFWSLEKKKRESVATSLFIFSEEGVSSGKFILQDFAQICAVTGAAAKMTATVRMQASFYCNVRHYFSFFFFFFWDMAVILKVYLKGLDKSWETRSWSQKSREGEKKKKKFSRRRLIRNSLPIHISFCVTHVSRFVKHPPPGV